MYWILKFLGYFLLETLSFLMAHCENATLNGLRFNQKGDRAGLPGIYLCYCLFFKRQKLRFHQAASLSAIVPAIEMIQGNTLVFNLI